MEISSAALSGLVDKTEGSAKTVAEGYDQFLRLLTTQLQYQDPLDPLDSTEFTNQLVQFSQVEQALLNNQKLDSLLAIQNNGLLSSSLQYIGKDVYFRGDTVYQNNEPIRIGYTLEDQPKSVKMRFVDDEGVTIRTVTLDSNVLTGHYVWDGKDDDGQVAPEGLYKVKIDGLNNDGKSIVSHTGVPAQVLGVETADGTVMLSLDGDRRIAATDVLSVSTPEEAEPEDEEETT